MRNISQPGVRMLQSDDVTALPKHETSVDFNREII